MIGVAAIVVSGIILQKIKAFAGDAAPFVMELPPYHAPAPSNIFRSTWERGWSFIKRAGTLILLSAVVIWFLQAFGVTSAGFGMVEDNNDSLLAAIGGGVAVIFAPPGVWTWQGEGGGGGGRPRPRQRKKGLTAMRQCRTVNFILLCLRLPICGGRLQFTPRCLRFRRPVRGLRARRPIQTFG